MLGKKESLCILLSFSVIISILAISNYSIDQLFLWDVDKRQDNYLIKEKEYTIAWKMNGTAISTENNTQYKPELCSDGAGGAIIVWEDDRNSNYDIFAQRIASNGSTLWIINGTSICSDSSNQYLPQICSDGNGGAIIVWEDYRGSSSDIYAQRINATGHVQWTNNGVAICTVSSNQYKPQICEDGNGGAVITWYDTDIYAQRIDSNGQIKWTSGGIPICDDVSSQGYPQICNVGQGNFVIAWHDYRDGGINANIYAQMVDLYGNVQWTDDGIPICTSPYNQFQPHLCQDGNGGAIIVWKDLRNGANYDIYTQRVDKNGNLKWENNGTPICVLSYTQSSPVICSDGLGGAVISWDDGRGSDWNIYAQRINSSGSIQWTLNGIGVCVLSEIQSNSAICGNNYGGATIVWEDYRTGTDYDIYLQILDWNGTEMLAHNGVALCNATDEQQSPKICSDQEGNAIIVWQDMRNSVNWDVYAKYINSSQNQAPFSNHPDDIETNSSGIESINWSISDDFGIGQYRIWANDTPNSYYIWKNWSIWVNNTNLKISINRSRAGYFNYTLEYKDINGLYGSSDTVFVNITNNAPTSNHPSDINTYANGTETINWTLYDDFGGSKYRVRVAWKANETYLLTDWMPWINNTNLAVSINRTNPGTFQYTIQYNDSDGEFGLNDIVIVTVENTLPLSNHPDDIITSVGVPKNISWLIYDDYGSGFYRVWVNNSNNEYIIWKDWTPWSNNTYFNVTINDTISGVYNYTIEFNDTYGITGIPDTVFVEVTSENPTSNHPEDINISIGTTGQIGWKLCDETGEGQYRVWLNDTNGKYYIWVNWTPWTNNTYLNIPINSSSLGTFNYTIEFNDSTDLFGYPDTVIVTVKGNNGIKQNVSAGFSQIYQYDDEGFLWVYIEIYTSSATNITITTNFTRPTDLSNLANGIIYYNIELENDSALINVTIYFYYKDNILGGIEENSLMIFWYDGAIKEWKQLETIFFDLNNK
ncbi:MAG: hypothetical protein ACTSR3_17110 [Candidatus Helarchaeota archaeon]